LAKYIKFLKPLKDRETKFSIKIGEEIPLDHEGIDDSIGGLYYCMVVNEQKYYLPEKWNNGQFEIVEKEEE
jgi:hypothetical protein